LLRRLQERALLGRKQATGTKSAAPLSATETATLDSQNSQAKAGLQTASKTGAQTRIGGTGNEMEMEARNDICPFIYLSEREL